MKSFLMVILMLISSIAFSSSTPTPNYGSSEFYCEARPVDSYNDGPWPWGEVSKKNAQPESWWGPGDGWDGPGRGDCWNGNCNGGGYRSYQGYGSTLEEARHEALYKCERYNRYCDVRCQRDNRGW